MIKIGVDLDSTLNDITNKWLSLYNQEYNDNLTDKDIIAWEIDKFVKPECGNKIYDYVLTPNFFLELNVQPYSQNILRWLNEYAEIYIVTAYHPYTCKDKADWLAKYFPFINQKNIIFCNQKYLLDLDYLIDDSPYNCNGFKGQYIVLDYPWNKSVGYKYPVMKNWLEIEEYFKNVFVDCKTIIKEYSYK